MSLCDPTERGKLYDIELARFLETRTDNIVEWSPGRREEG